MVQPELHFYLLDEHVTAFSTTRHGGYSEGNYGAFNINHYCGDSEEAISKNRELLCRLLGIDYCHLMMPHQVHQTEMVTIDQDFLGLSFEEQKERLEGVDALMTDVKGICIGVSTADCIPVLLYDKVHHCACAIHAGWRGTVKRIVEKAVGEMMAVYNSHPTDIVAQIGPGIHLDSFEVGDEVYEAFEKEGFNMELISKRYPINYGGSKSFTVHHSPLPSKWHIDLPACNRQQLISSGVPASQIAVSDSCTFQQYKTYFSARRLGINSGRVFTGILLR